MATRIRLRRTGAAKRPFYRVVVTDQRNPRDGRFIENIGKYHPLADPSVIDIDQDRALHWLRTGAQPSNTVRNLFDKIGIWETFTTERPAIKQKQEALARTNAMKDEKLTKAEAAAAKAKAKAEAAAPKTEAPEPKAEAVASEPSESDEAAVPSEDSTEA